MANVIFTELVEKIDDIKDKLTSQEYLTIMHNLQSLFNIYNTNNNDTNNNNTNNNDNQEITNEDVEVLFPGHIENDTDYTNTDDIDINSIPEINTEPNIEVIDTNRYITPAILQILNNNNNRIIHRYRERTSTTRYNYYNNMNLESTVTTSITFRYRLHNPNRNTHHHMHRYSHIIRQPRAQNQQNNIHNETTQRTRQDASTNYNTTNIIWRINPSYSGDTR
jgi:hypothetical protein